MAVTRVETDIITSIANKSYSTRCDTCVCRDLQN